MERLFLYMFFKTFLLITRRPSHEKISFDTSKPTGAVSRALDNSLAKELLGWEPRFSLQEGLKKTIEWYTKNHKKQGHIDKSSLLEHN